jgi:hypothetical protein
MTTGMKASIGPVPERPRVELPQPQVEDRVQGAEGQQVHDRGHQRDEQAAEHDHEQEERQEHDHGDERRELVGEHVGEVDVGGRHPADVDDQAGAVLGPGDEVMAEVVHQVDGLAGLRAGGLWGFFRRAAV